MPDAAACRTKWFVHTHAKKILQAPSVLGIPWRPRRVVTLSAGFRS